MPDSSPLKRLRLRRGLFGLRFGVGHCRSSGMPDSSPLKVFGSAGNVLGELASASTASYQGQQRLWLGLDNLFSRSATGSASTASSVQPGLRPRRPLPPRPLAQPRQPLPGLATASASRHLRFLGRVDDLGDLFRDVLGLGLPRPRADRRPRSRTDPSQPARPRRTRSRGPRPPRPQRRLPQLLPRPRLPASRGSSPPTRTTRSRTPGAGSGRCAGGRARCAARAAGAGRRAKPGSADGQAGCRPSRTRAAGPRRRCAAGRTRRSR